MNEKEKANLKSSYKTNKFSSLDDNEDKYCRFWKSFHLMTISWHNTHGETSLSRVILTRFNASKPYYLTIYRAALLALSSLTVRSGLVKGCVNSII